jgi:CBS domain-containing protein
MRDADAGAVIALQDGNVAGIVTYRDIAVRVVAAGKGPDTPVLQGILQAVQVMRANAARRLPVIESGRPVGIVSIGDLAIERDSESALADISAAEGNT